jgi:hypothetical protein
MSRFFILPEACRSGSPGQAQFLNAPPIIQALPIGTI